MELLKNRIEEVKQNTTDFAIDFVNDYSGSSEYLGDAISEFADSNTSIYYSSIIEYIKDNPDAVNDAINEFGWDGCGKDIYKAGQMAEYLEIQNELYSEIDNIILLLALKELEQYENITEEHIKKAEEIEFEGIDQNSRIDDIADYVAGIMEDGEND